MVVVDTVAAILAFGALLAVTSTVPYGLTAIDYRRRDNGLAYLFLVLGVGIWNLMFVVQLLSPDPVIESFFLGLAVVGSVQSGLGWFLFATTASSTSGILDRRSVYTIVAILGGLDIVFAMTTPVHTFYWQLPATAGDPTIFAAVVPGVGYWLHTALLVGLFAAGASMFGDTWRRRRDDSYVRAYAIAGVATALAVLACNALWPGGFGVAPLFALGLTSIGWLQAARGQPFAWLRPAR